MSFISEYICEKNNAGEKILSVFLTSGFPDKNNFVEIALNVLKSGADILEIGFPFSDPLADGPIIQSSSQAALHDNINLEQTFAYIKEIRENSRKPLIMMGYANPVLSYGRKKFASDAIDSGANGIIIPDVPIEEYDDFFNEDFIGLDIILLITPTTSVSRIKLIDEKSSGFVYCVSTKGTTGNFDKRSSDNLKFVQDTYSLVSKNKMLVGFGISDAEDAKLYSGHCDGVIVGSAVIKSLMNAKLNFQNTSKLVKNLKKSLG